MPNDGLVTLQSSHDVATTLERLTAALEAKGRDPLAFRLRHIDDDRFRRVVERVAEPARSLATETLSCSSARRTLLSRTRSN